MERIRNGVGEAIISRANLPQQFDEHVSFDETRAMTSRDTAEIKGLPDTYPRVKLDVDPRPDLPIESSWVYEFDARDERARRAAKS